MTDTPEVISKKYGGILQKRDKSVVVPTNSVALRLSAYRARNQQNLNTPIAKLDNVGKTPNTLPDNPKTASAKGTSFIPVLDGRSTNIPLSHKPGYIPAYLRNRTNSKKRTSVDDSRAIFSKENKTTRDNKPATARTKPPVSTRLSTTITESWNNNSAQNSVPLKSGNIPAIANGLVVSQMHSNKEEFNEIRKELPNLTCQRELCKSEIKSNKSKEIPDDRIFSKFTQRIHGIQVHSFKLLREFYDRLAMINKQAKLTDNLERGDTNLCQEKFQNIFKEIEVKLLKEEEQQNTRIISLMADLQQIMFNKEGTPIMLNLDVSDEYENYRKISERKINAFEMKIKDLELKKIRDDSITTENSVKELIAALSESQKKRDERDKEFDKLLLKLKQAELTNKRLEKQLDAKTLEVITKDQSITDLHRAKDLVEEKVAKYLKQIQKLDSKLVRTDEEHKIQIDQLKKKYDEEVKKGNVLRFQVNALNLGMTEETRTMRDENLKLRNKEKLFMNEICSLKYSLNDLQLKESTNKRSKTDENLFRREMERLDEELTGVKTTVCKLKKELVERETLLAKKEQVISDLENLVKQLEKRDQLNELQKEILKLQDINAVKGKEIEQLQRDLDKTETAFQLQKESLSVQQQLLEIRNTLLQSLQEKSGPIEHQNSDINCEIGKSMIKQLNQESCRRQDHIIKLLEETHKKICIKQNSKIMRLECENAELKRLI